MYRVISDSVLMKNINSIIFTPVFRTPLSTGGHFHMWIRLRQERRLRVVSRLLAGAHFRARARVYFAGNAKIRDYSQSYPIYTGLTRSPLRWLLVVFLFFFCLVRLLKTKFLSEGNLRFLPYCTIVVTFDQRFVFHWFPSNRGYRSNNTGIVLFLNKADVFEI